MTAWVNRPSEEAYLLNPAYCSLVLWSAIGGYAEISENAMSFTLSFMVLPVVLHKPTRDELPRAISTSLANWIESHPALALRFPERARSLVVFTKEAIVFGANRKAIQVSPNGALGVGPVSPNTKKFLAESTEEVRDSVSKARFVGRWFAKAGTPATVMALWGVSP